MLEDIGGDSLTNCFKQSRLTLLEGLKVAIEICQGLADIHAQKIVHKNINPANIIWNRNSNAVKIIDFGIASNIERSQAFPGSPRMLEGNIMYMSPEQTGRMNRPLDYRTDFYSLGITLFELFTGKMPFECKDSLEMIHCHIAKQPLAPTGIDPSVPDVLSQIVLKLMEKNTEDRYQSANGIKADLIECLRQFELSGKILSFPLARNDSSDRFQLPAQLYGREAQVVELEKAFKATCAGGTKFSLVTGHSGVGKSCLVQELYRPLAIAKGRYISGKYDQYNRTVPYSALGQALSFLCDQFLAESGDVLDALRTQILNAIGKNGQILTEIIAHLELIIGAQPPVAALDPQAAQNRFNRTFHDFVQAICSPEKPLVLFIDDLQWADGASLALFQSVLSDSSISGLHLVGAYRDNEVQSTHPLFLMLNTLGNVQDTISTIHLDNLSFDSVVALVSDTLSNATEDASALAKIIFEKTEGNAFFTTEFLKALHVDESLTYSRTARKWEWDINQIQSRQITDNVVELMCGRIGLLPDATQNILKRAACIGNQFDLRILGVISENVSDLPKVLSDLMPAIQHGIVIPQNERYKNIGFVDEDARNTTFKFQHDRVQQAAYSLIPESEKPKIHLNFGRLLLGGTIEAREIEEKLFEIVSHLNKGISLIVDNSEKIEIARLNLRAGIKARQASAYQAALEHFTTAKHLLPDGSFSSQYQLSFDIYLNVAKSLSVNGKFEDAEKLYPFILKHAKTALDKALIHTVQMEDYHLQGNYDKAIEVQMQGLALLGENVPQGESVFELAIDLELQKVSKLLGKRSIAALVDSPKIDSIETHATLKLLMGMWMSSYLVSKESMVQWTSVRMTNICLQHGNNDIAAFAFVQFGYLCIGRLQEFQKGYEFGKMALSLSDRYDNLELRGKVYFMFGLCISHWKKHVSLSTESFRKGYLFSVEGGDWTYAVYGAANIISNLLIAGAPCNEVCAEAQTYLSFLKDKATVGLTSFFLPGGYCALLNLQGKTVSRESFDCEYLDEAGFLETLGQLPIVEGWFYAVKLRSLFLFRCFEDGVKVIAKAEVVAIGVPGQVKIPEAYFYSCLMLAATHQSMTGQEANAHYWTLFEKYAAQMKTWAENCPENFLHKHYLIQAEKCRVESAPLDKTLALYDRAIESAKDNGYYNNEALAYELKGRYWLEQGQRSYAIGDLTDALQGYRQWGVTEKVLMLEQEILDLSREKSRHVSAAVRGTTEVDLGHLDLMSVYKASHAISGELVLPDLLEKLIRIVMEHTGAQKGFLLLLTDDKLSIGVEANVNLGEHLLVSQPSVSEQSPLPQSVLNYVKRTHEKVALEDASKTSMFSSDKYLVQNNLKSVLCLPMLKQSKLIGIIYLENNLITGAFTNDRLAIVEILLGQIVISIENASLFRKLGKKVSQLQESENQFRSLADSMPQIVWTADPDGNLDYYNQRWYEYTGLTYEQTKGWGWGPVLHPDDFKKCIDIWSESVKTGKPYQIEYRFKRAIDSAYRWHLGRALPFKDEDGNIFKWFGTCTDIHEQKLAEEERARAASDLKDALIARDEFLSIASHELKTPLTSLKLHAQILKRLIKNGDQSAYSKERVDSLVEQTDKQSSRLNRLVDDMLDVSRIRTGILTIKQEEFDFRELVRESIERLRSQFEASGKSVPALTANCSIVGNWDKLRIEQVISNLLTNAIRYGKGNPVSVRVWEENDEVFLSIEDKGFGISKAAQDKIFDRFERAINASEVSGLGLGLFITKQIVVAHGGRIWVQSELEKGSTFFIAIPKSFNPEKANVV